MLTYSALVTLYLLYFGIRGEWVGPLLWPVVVLHAILTLLLAREVGKGRAAEGKLPKLQNHRKYQN
jgi:hypothetical protein